MTSVQTRATSRESFTRFRNVGQVALDFLAAQIPSEQGSVMLVDGAELEVIAARGHREDIVGVRVEQGESIAWPVIESGRSAHFSGLIGGQRHAYRENQCSVVVPIAAPGGSFGAFNLNRRAWTFGRHEVELLEGFATSFGRILALRGYLRGAKVLGVDAEDALVGFIEVNDPSLSKRAAHMGSACRDLAISHGLSRYAADIDRAAVLSFLVVSQLPRAQRARDLSRTDLWVALRVLAAEAMEALGVRESVCELVRGSARFSEFGVFDSPMALGSGIIKAAMAAFAREVSLAST